MESTRVGQVTPETPGIPRALVYGLYGVSPVIGFLATVISEKFSSRQLDASTEASGPHDFAVRFRYRSSKIPPASPASHPASVTIAYRPSCGTGRRWVYK